VKDVFGRSNGGLRCANPPYALMAFWQSGKYTTTDVFPDSLPWLFVRGSAGALPWAARHLD